MSADVGSTTFISPMEMSWKKWFSLVLLNTQWWPKSCCSQPAWAWEKRDQEAVEERSRELATYVRRNLVHSVNLLNVLYTAETQ